MLTFEQSFDLKTDRRHTLFMSVKLTPVLQLVIQYTHCQVQSLTNPEVIVVDPGKYFTHINLCNYTIRSNNKVCHVN